jgi:hypothetical protein
VAAIMMEAEIKMVVRQMVVTLGGMVDLVTTKTKINNKKKTKSGLLFLSLT